mmetsp:Transcript_21724/g.61453  ORF Transcript_21724/g.61453 Transcript_21724/m.61453 type:complete len:379 (+) Transcript_21724:127-1263(+)
MDSDGVVAQGSDEGDGTIAKVRQRVGSAVPPRAALGASAGPGVAGRSHHHFLDRLKHPSAQSVVNEARSFVDRFTADLSRPQAARRIHAFLSDVIPRLIRTDAFSDLPEDEAADFAMEGMEKFVVLKLFKVVFRHSPADLREDEHVDFCIHAAASSPLSALPPLTGQAHKMFDDASDELKKVDQFRCPRDKAVCLSNAYGIVEGIVVEEAFSKGSSKTSETEDDGGLLRRLLVALICRSAPVNLSSSVEFVKAFRHPSRVSAEEQRTLREFAAALATITGRARAAQNSHAARSGDVGSGASPNAEGADEGSALPLWLVDAGVTFHFEDTDGGELRVADLDELLDEYHKMARALRELAGLAEPDSSSARAPATGKGLLV